MKAPELFRTKKRPIDSADAEFSALVDQQVMRWTILLERISDKVGDRVDFGRDLKLTMKSLGREIDQSRGKIYRQEDGHHGASLLSRLPIIGSEHVQKLLDEDTLTVLGGIFAEVAYPIMMVLIEEGRDASPWGVFTHPLLLIGFNRYEREKRHIEILELKAQVDGILEDARLRTEQFNSDLRKLEVGAEGSRYRQTDSIQTLDRTVEAAKAKLKAIQDIDALAADTVLRSEEKSSEALGKLNEIRERFETVSTDSDKFFDSVTIEIHERAEKTVRAYLDGQSAFRKIAEPVKLFEKTAINHRATYNRGVKYLCSAVAVLAVLGMLVVSFLVWMLGLSDPNIPPFTARGSLALVALIGLMAAVGWVLKIAGRLVTNSLTLAEDAEIRSALANAYLGFVANATDGEIIRDADRTIMLAALFRPLPGHQQEDIEAPTVLGLAKEALLRK